MTRASAIVEWHLSSRRQKRAQKADTDWPDCVRVFIMRCARVRYTMTLVVEIVQRRQERARGWLEERSARTADQFSSVQFSSVQFKMVSMRSGRPICAPPRLSKVSPMLPLRHSSNIGLIDDGPFLVLSRKIVERFHFLQPLSFRRSMVWWMSLALSVPAGSVSRSSTWKRQSEDNTHVKLCPSARTSGRHYIDHCFVMFGFWLDQNY